MFKRRLIIILSVIVIFSASLALMKIFSEQKKNPEQKEKTNLKRLVKAEVVKYSTLETNIKASGRLASTNYVDVISEVQGKILPGGVTLKKGQTFNKGQVLARIYEKDALYNLQAKKSKFLTSIANLLADFKIDFPGSFKTWNSFFESIDITKELPDLPKEANKQEKIFLATRNILSDYYSIKADETRLSKYTIYAPFNGSFTDVLLEVGSVANPGSRIAKIIETDQLELEVPIEVTNADWINLHDEVALSNREGTHTWKGKVIRKSRFVDSGTQSLSIFVQVIPQREQELYAGMYLEATFSGMIIENGMALPRKAVFNGNEVFIVEKGLLSKQQIKVIKVNETTLIFNGLPEGKIVVSEPLVSATENMEVEVMK